MTQNFKLNMTLGNWPLFVSLTLLGELNLVSVSLKKIWKIVEDDAVFSNPHRIHVEHILGCW